MAIIRQPSVRKREKKENKMTGDVDLEDEQDAWHEWGWAC